MQIESGYILLPELTDDKIQVTLIDNKSIVFTSDYEIRNKIQDTFLIREVTGSFISLGKLTFYNCQLFDKHSRPAENIVQYKILFDSYVQGDTKTKLFNELIIYSNSLTKWHTQELKVEYTHKEEFISIDIPSETQTVFLKANEEYTVKMFEQFTSSHSISTNHAEFEVGLSIKFLTPVDYGEIKRKIYQVKKFIEFLTKKDASIVTIRIKLDNSKSGSSLKLHLSKLKTFENLITDIEVNEFGLKDDFGNLFLKWITSAKYHNALDLLRENRDNKVSPHIAFFNCCMAIESIHSDINGLEHFNEERAQFHEKVKKNVKSKLNWTNDEEVRGVPFSLDLSEEIIKYLVAASREKKRTTFKEKVEPIKEHLQYISNVILENCYSGQEKPFDVYLNDIVKTRNNLTHNGNRYQYFKSDYFLLIVALTIDFSLQLYILKLLGMKSAYLLQIQEYAREILMSLYESNATLHSAFYEEKLDDQAFN